jgi:hypothetical protein
VALGWQSGERCFPSIEQAGSHACGQVFGVTNSGLLSCTGYTVSAMDVTLTLSSGTTEAWVPQRCERFDWTGTWGPLYGAILVGAVSIVCVRWMVDFFKRDYEA